MDRQQLEKFAYDKGDLKLIMIKKKKGLIEVLKGGKGSGDWGHKGRPGKRGGSGDDIETTVKHTL